MKNEWIVSNNRKIRLLHLKYQPEFPYIIFIPGMGCYSDIYLIFLEELGACGFNILSIDLDGHGLSEGRRGHFTFQEIMTTIENTVMFVKANTTASIGLLGSSLGGTYALYYAINNNIDSVICHCVMDISSDLHIPTKYPKLVKTLIKFSFLAKIFPLIPVPLKFLVNWQNVVDGNNNLLKELSKDKRMVWYYSLFSWCSFIKYKKNLQKNLIKIPYKVIVGSNDLLFPPIHCEQVVQKLGDTNENLEIFHQGGHFLPFNNRSEFIKNISIWFKNTLNKTQYPDNPLPARV